MSSTMLDRAALKVFESSEASITQYLEPTNVDVRRLRDDRSEIRPGDDVAFVATVTFRVTDAGAKELQRTSKQEPPRLEDLRNLAAGDVLFEIRSDGELVSPHFAIDDEDIEPWLADHYEFAFLLDGHPSPAFGPVQRHRARSTGQVPWIRKLNTAALKDDYIDIDVRVGPAPSPPAPPPVKHPPLRLADSEAYFDGKKHVMATLALRVPTSAHMLGRTVRIPLEGCDEHLELFLAFHEPDQDQPQQPPQQPPTKASDKHPKS